MFDLYDEMDVIIMNEDEVVTTDTCTEEHLEAVITYWSHQGYSVHVEEPMEYAA